MSDSDDEVKSAEEKDENYTDEDETTDDDDGDSSAPPRAEKEAGAAAEVKPSPPARPFRPALDAVDTKFPANFVKRSNFHVLHPEKIMDDHPGFSGPRLAMVLREMNKLLRKNDVRVRVDESARRFLQFCIQLIKILSEAGEMALILMLKQYRDANKQRYGKHPVMMHTSVYKTKDGEYLLSPDLVWLRQDIELEYQIFECAAVVMVGVENSFFYMAVEQLAQKIEKKQLTAQECRDFVPVFLDAFSTKQTGSNAGALSTFTSKMSFKDFSKTPVQKIGAMVVMARFNKKEGLGLETGRSMLSKLSEEENETIRKESQKRIEFFIGKQSAWGGGEARPRRGGRKRASAGVERPLRCAIPSCEDFKQLLLLERRSLIDIMKKKSYDPDVHGAGTGKNVHWVVDLDFADVHYRQKLAELFKEEAVDFMFGMLIHVLKEHKNLDGNTDVFEEPHEIVNIINKNFFVHLKCKDSTKNEFPELLEKFMKSARKYFMMFLSLKSTKFDTASVTACLYLNESLILRVLEKAMQHGEFLKESLLFHILSVHDVADNTMLFELVPSILVNLLYSFMYDAYFMHVGELQEREMRAEEYTNWETYMEKAHYGKIIRFATNVTLPPISLTACVRYAEYVEGFEPPREFTPEVYRVSFTPQRWWVPAESCTNLDWSLFMVYKEVEISSADYAKVSVRFAKSAQGVVLSKLLEPLVQQFTPQMNAFLRPPFPTELEGLVPQFERCRKQLVDFHEHFFLDKSEPFFVQNFLNYFFRDMVIGFLFKFTDFTGLPSKIDDCPKWTAIVDEIGDVDMEIEGKAVGMRNEPPEHTLDRGTYSTLKQCMAALVLQIGMLEPNVLFLVPVIEFKEKKYFLRPTYQLEPKAGEVYPGFADCGLLQYSRVLPRDPLVGGPPGSAKRRKRMAVRRTDGAAGGDGGADGDDGAT